MSSRRLTARLSSRPFARWLVGFVICSMWLWTGPTRADGPAISLTPGKTCLERARLVESLDALPDRHIDSSGLNIDVQGSAHDPRTAVIRVLRANELLAERAFSPGPPRCADFHNAIALAISLMIRTAEIDVGPTPSAVESPPLVSPVAAPPASIPDRPAAGHREPVLPFPRPPHAILVAEDRPAPRAQHGLRLAVRATAQLGAQIGGSFSRGLSGELGLGFAWLDVQLGLIGLFSTEQQLGKSHVRYRTRPLAGSLSAAVRLVSSRSLVLRAVLGVSAGRMRFTVADDVRRSPWFAGRAALELAFPVTGPLALTLSLGPLWSSRQLGLESVDQETGELIAQQPFQRVGALFGFGVAYERERQGSGRKAHP